jgi:hypothetical protein
VQQWQQFVDQLRSTDTTAEVHLRVGFLDMVATAQQLDVFLTGLSASARAELDVRREKAKATLDSLRSAKLLP